MRNLGLKLTIMQQHKNSTSVMESATIQKNEASSKSPTSRRHFFNYFVIAAILAIVVTLTSCGGGGIGSSSYKIKITREEGGYFPLMLKGNGVATVDWGDGSEKVSLTLNEEKSVEFEHSYPNASIRTIIINGDNITGLTCYGISNLDVSRCTELTLLGCSGTFTSLDLRKNTALKGLYIVGNQCTYLDLSKNTALTELLITGSQLTNFDLSKNTVLTKLEIDNLLTSSTLNALFRTLHSNTGEKIIFIENNPGSKDCDRSIAESKGWMFRPWR